MVVKDMTFTFGGFSLLIMYRESRPLKFSSATLDTCRYIPVNLTPEAVSQQPSPDTTIQQANKNTILCLYHYPSTPPNPIERLDRKRKPAIQGVPLRNNINTLPPRHLLDPFPQPLRPLLNRRRSRHMRRNDLNTILPHPLHDASPVMHARQSGSGEVQLVEAEEAVSEHDRVLGRF